MGANARDRAGGEEAARQAGKQARKQTRNQAGEQARRQADKDEAMTARAPNILIVMADQMAPAFLPIYGHASTRAPNMALARRRRRRVRERLLQQPPLLAFAGLAS